MRKCIVCGEFKDESEFGWRNIEKNYLQSVCAPCRRSQMQDRYQNNMEGVKKINKTSRLRSREAAQQYVSIYLSTHPCGDCGESDPVVLTFHHVNGKKRMEVSLMVTQGYAIKALEEEISKCVVLCFNCHMRREKRRRSGY